MSQRQVETGRAMRAHASKDSKTQKKVPKRFVKPTGEDAIAGRYEAGIKNDKFTLLFGQTVATWVHVEDQMIQVLQDLLGSKSAPARQIFHFGVGVSTAIVWVRRLRETGSVAPGQMGGHKPKAISGEHRAWLLERTKARDFTLRGLVAELADRGL
jgi:hypothetical protein